MTSPRSYVRLVPWIAVGIAALAALHFLDTASLLTAQLERIRGLGPWGPVAFIALYVLVHRALPARLRTHPRSRRRVRGGAGLGDSLSRQDGRAQQPPARIGEPSACE